MTAEELKNIFESPYTQQSWINVLREVLGIKNILIKPQAVDTTTNNWEAKGFELGNFETLEGRLVGVYEVQISDTVKLERNKVGLRNLLKPIYDNDVDAALIVFNQGSQWRFSYVSQVRVRNKETNRREKKTTDPKRYTYLFGKGQKCRTAAERFAKIQQHYNLFGGAVKLEEIEKAFSVDSLTKDFYRELSDWYFRALKEVKFPDDAERAVNPKLKKEELEKEEKTRNATNTIRLITRLIFVWFLKQKNLVPDELFDKNEIDKIINYKDKTGSTYYKAILQNLFFATLNTEMGDENRKFIERQYGVQTFYRYKRFFKNTDRFLELTKNIPFLNGGLFENLDKNIEDTEEDNKIRIDCFSNALKNEGRLTVPDSLFFDEETVDLSEDYGDKKKKGQKVRGLVNILQSYNFTIEENTPFEIEVALDPELLGKVFENLLASYNPETETTARKMTGSFYTPREIVDYMVDESLKAYLANYLPGQSEEKLNQLFSYTTEVPELGKEEKEKLIHALDEAKILDPACGSGAFPMGVLHKMVLLLNKLDPDNNNWKELQRKKAIEETEEAFRLGNKTDRDERLKNISEAFEDNSDDYGRKLYLIENCIYGVDIQPIAVQIAKLRFFISLICDQEVNDKRKNRGVRPLPNLETKFVAANTLIGLNKPKQLLLRNPKIEELEAELNEVRHKHFSARTSAAKRKWRSCDHELREQIGQLLKFDGWDNTTAEQIANWNPYDQNTFAEFYDNEWMFGILDGFDIVIGNPPYILIQNLELSSTVKEIYESYEVAQYKTDLYHLFIQRGIDIINKKSGILTYITSNTFLKNKHNNKLRKYIVNKTNCGIVVLFYKQVFENASVDNAIFLFSNYLKANQKINVIDIKEDFSSDIQKKAIEFEQKDIIAPDYKFNFDSDFDSNLVLSKIEKETWAIKDIGRAYFGIQTFDRNKHVSPSKISDTYLPVVDGGNIKKYFLTNFTEFIDFQKANIKSGGNPDVYVRERIIVRQIGESPFGTICPPNILTLNTVYNIFLFREEILLRYVLAIINSKVQQFYWKKLFYDNKKTFPKIKKDALEALRIRKAPKESQELLARIVDYVLFLKKRESDYSDFFENLIDALVYELYFPNEVISANCEITKHLSTITNIGQFKNEKDRLAEIEKMYIMLNNRENPVRIAMFNMDTIEEIAIIEGKSK